MITKTKNKKRTNIAIIDYGIGNLYSVSKAFCRISRDIVITDDAKEIAGSGALILPGVGSFGAGMKGLEVRNLVKVIKDFAETGKPILGICLGAQLMLKKGYELGEFDGLGIIDGKAVKLINLPQGVKVPHIGWNQIKPPDSGSKDKLLTAIKGNSYFYFVHSYILEPEKKENILAETEYGGRRFCSIIKKGNMYGCQFHPEKSGETGLKLIKNFINLVKNG